MQFQQKKSPSSVAWGKRSERMKGRKETLLLINRFYRTKIPYRIWSKKSMDERIYEVVTTTSSFFNSWFERKSIRLFPIKHTYIIIICFIYYHLYSSAAISRFSCQFLQRKKLQLKKRKIYPMFSILLIHYHFKTFYRLKISWICKSVSHKL